MGRRPSTTTLLARRGLVAAVPWRRAIGIWFTLLATAATSTDAGHPAA